MNEKMLRASLIKHEGVSYLPYADSLGAQTIGIGHNLEVPLSKAAVDQIFKDDLAMAISELHRKFAGWDLHNDNRQNVLIEMLFNLGAPRLGSFKKMWASLYKRDYNQAALEMLDSLWADQVGERAETLAAIMRAG